MPQRPPAQSERAWWERWLTVRGRASRREYVTLFACFIVAQLAIAVAFPASSRPYLDVGDRHERGIWPGIVLRMILLFPWIAATGRRLHDQGKSALWAALIWVPPLNMIFGAIPKGEPRSNAYGPAPNSSSESSAPCAPLGPAASATKASEGTTDRPPSRPGAAPCRPYNQT